MRESESDKYSERKIERERKGKRNYDLEYTAK